MNTLNPMRTILKVTLVVASCGTLLLGASAYAAHKVKVSTTKTTAPHTVELVAPTTGIQDVQEPAVVTAPTLPTPPAPTNIYTLTNHLTALQTDTFLKFAALLALVGFLLAERRILQRAYSAALRYFSRTAESTA